MTADVNGDGLDDVIVGEPLASGGVGQVHVFFASVGGLSQARIIPAPTVMQGPQQLTAVAFGFSIAAADFDGDGASDLVIGAPFEGPGDSIVGGSIWGYTNLATLAAQGSITPAWSQPSNIPNEEFGFSVTTTPDTNMDSLPDVVAGAPGAANVMSLGSTGAIYSYIGFSGMPLFGPVQPAFPLPPAPCETVQPARAIRFGHQVVGGDFDGFVETIGGASVTRGDVIVKYRLIPIDCPGVLPIQRIRGEVWQGVANGFSPTVVAASINEFVSPVDFPDLALANAGDMQGDGIVDVLAGTRSTVLTTEFGTNSGAVRAVSVAGGQVTTLHLDRGLASNDRLGELVASLGDINGDGLSDAVGATSALTQNGYLKSFSSGAPTALSDGTLGAPLGVDFDPTGDGNDTMLGIASLDRLGNGRRMLAIAVDQGGQRSVVLRRFDDPCVQLSAKGNSVSVGEGAGVAFFIDLPTTFAGTSVAPFLTPALDSNGLPDITTPLASNSNQFFLSSTQVIDPAGQAMTALQVEGNVISPALIGITLYAGYVVLASPGQFPFVSSPVSFLIED